MPTYKEIVQKISELQRQADELRANEQATVIAEIKQKIVEYGLTADDLCIPVEVMDRPALGKLMEDQDVVLSF